MPLSPKADASLRARVDRDHLQAAWTATTRQRQTEQAAAAQDMSVGDYMRSINKYPCQEFVERGPLMDPIEADHTYAGIIATNRERKAEAYFHSMDYIRELNHAAYLRANKTLA